MNETALTEHIRAAFAGVTLGSGVSLREADVIDAYGSDVERARAHALDVTDAWWNVPPEDLERFRPFAFLDDAGFAFYLPAYMTHALRRDSHGDTAEQVLWALDPATPHNFGAITPEQAEVIAAYLQFAEERDPHENILYSQAWTYWSARAQGA